MFKEQLIVWTTSNNLKYSISGNEFKTTCQSGTHVDRNPSFSINMITGLYNCWSCGFKGHVNYLLGLKPDEDSIRISRYLTLNRMWEDQESSEEPHIPIELPPIDFMITEGIRGIPKEILMGTGVYYCSIGRYSGRLIFPVRDTRGNLLGFDARIYEHPSRPLVIPSDYFKNAKYLRPSSMKTADLLYPLNYLWEHRDTLDLSSIVLVEGIFDALSYIALGTAAVCNFGLNRATAEKAGQLMSLGTQEICLGFDADTAGIKATPEVKESWRPYLSIGRISSLTQAIYNSKEKDANDYLQGLTTM